MELDKENQDYQGTGTGPRKSGMVDPGAGIPRTPFAEVNRQHRTDTTGTDGKSRRSLTTLAGKQFSQASHTKGSVCTPVRGHSKGTLLQRFDSNAASISLPASPTVTCPLSATADVSPGVSQSCPQVLSGLSLPPLLETPSPKLETPSSESSPTSESDGDRLCVPEAEPAVLTYLAEYAKFVETYAQDDSPGLSSSLTEVTPCSVDDSPASPGPAESYGGMVVLDSLSSFISDSDDSLSSSSTVQRHLAFEDTELTDDDNLDQSTGFVRSSQSKLDLRETSPASSSWENLDADGRSLSFSVCDQGVEFLALPSSSSLLRSTPNARCVASESTASLGASPTLERCAQSPLAVSANKDVCDAPSSDVETVTVHSEVVTESSLALSASSRCEQETLACQQDTVTCQQETVTVTSQQETSTETGVSARTSTAVDMCSIALSPMRFDVSNREKEMNTDAVEVNDADTMTIVAAYHDVALSPVAAAVRDADTMTHGGAGSVEAGVGTEAVSCLDHSVLATAEVDVKTTMTDTTGSRSVHTTMTPLKALAKQGNRLTSSDIRKQHPRSLANQLETLTVSNARLETQLSAAYAEHRRLQAELKDARNTVATRVAELSAQEKERLDSLKEEEVEGLRKSIAELERELRSALVEKKRLQGELEEARRQLSKKGDQVQTSKVLGVTKLKKPGFSSRLPQGKAGAHLNKRTPSAQASSSEASHTHPPSTEASHTHPPSTEASHIHAPSTEGSNIQPPSQASTSKEDLAASAVDLAALQQDKADLEDQISSLRQTLAINNDNLSLAALQQDKADLMDQINSLRKTLAINNDNLSVAALQQDKADLVDQISSLTHTLAINNGNLSELEKLYSASSSDLLTATGKLMELHAELMAARKESHGAQLSRDALGQQVTDLGVTLAAVEEDRSRLRAALDHAQTQVQQQAAMYGKLQVLSQKMKTIYEDKIENMALGVDNLQLTLDNRAVDVDNLEKDLYQCRNIIVEQRYAMDALNTKLRESQALVQAQRDEDEDIEFFKQSNSFLEAERALYVQSLRDLEDKLKVTSADGAQQREALTRADLTLLDLQEQHQRLTCELSASRQQHASAAHSLQRVQEEQERAESMAVAASNDLLQHMHLSLAGLKKKIGLQDVPELFEEQPQPPPPPPPPTQAVPPAPSRAGSKSKRQSRKSLVSKILSAASPKAGGSLGTLDQEDEETDAGSYSHHPASLDVSADRGVREVNVSAPGFFPSSEGHSDSHHSRASSLSVSVSAPFSPTRSSSSLLPPHSLRHPPASEPPSCAFAQIRAIPKSKQRRSEQPRGSGGAREEEGWERGPAGDGSEVLSRLASLKEVFSSIVRLASILDRASQLSLNDLREENDMLRERTEILEERMERNAARLNISSQETVAKETTISQLQQQLREVTGNMMTMTDFRFEVKRLSAEVKRLEAQLQSERGEKEMLSSELESLLRRLETSAHSPSSASSTDRGTAQARCMRDIIALKKKNQQLTARLEEQRDHSEEVGSKAARRMRVLDDNWKKAEDEVYRLDDLVDNIQKIAEGCSESSYPQDGLQRIVGLIRGESMSAPR